MNIVLIDSADIWQSLLPLTVNKPISALKVGILTIAQKWQYYLPQSSISVVTQDYLQQKYTANATSESIYILSNILPNPALAAVVQQLQSNHKLVNNETILAYKNTAHSNIDSLETVNYALPFDQIKYTWDLFTLNGSQLRADFALITKNKVSEPITDSHTIVYGKENIFIESGVSIKAAILNAEEGPIYIGQGATVHEGAIIKGACAIGEYAHVNMGAKLRGDNTIGAYCKVGGEISNSIINNYSNKGHDGFLGNSILGEWCNLGADTNTSNLKNNYSNVRVYHYPNKGYIDTHQQFVGLTMADHSKAGINTMFNTGAVVGFCSNIFGAGFPPKYIPSFSWCDSGSITEHSLDKALESVARVMVRRNTQLDVEDISIFKHIHSSKF